MKNKSSLYGRSRSDANNRISLTKGEMSKAADLPEDNYIILERDRKNKRTRIVPPCLRKDKWAVDYMVKKHRRG